MSEHKLTVQTNVVRFMKSNDCMTSHEVADALEAKVTLLLDAAIQRARANGRKTVMARDF